MNTCTFAVSHCALMAQTLRMNQYIPGVSISDTMRHFSRTPFMSVSLGLFLSLVHSHSTIPLSSVELLPHKVTVSKCFVFVCRINILYNKRVYL